MNDQHSRRWYEAGLRFCCTCCSLCCRFESGYVWLSQTDLERIAEATRLRGAAEAAERFCRVVEVGGLRQLSLREQPNSDCVFWNDGGCSIYDHRPAQCSSYPFWAQSLASEEQWRATGAACPGVGVGRCFSADQIDAVLAQRRGEELLSGGAFADGDD